MAGKKELTIADKDIGKIVFGDNGYGEMSVFIRGPRNGERGDFLLSRENAYKLSFFLQEWLLRKGE